MNNRLRVYMYMYMVSKVVIKVAGTLINMHNLWSPQKCASVNAGLCVELRHLAIARAQTCILSQTAGVPKYVQIKSYNFHSNKRTSRQNFPLVVFQQLYLPTALS